MKITLKALTLFIVCLFLFGCTGSKNEQSKSQTSSFFELEEPEINSGDSVNYRIPTPIDLFVLMENSGIQFLPEATNTPSARVKYSTITSKALNFGVYTADMAYCSVFGNFQGSLVYFNTAKDIAVDLGMYEGYGKQMAFRINNNLSNIDSLIDISVDSYYQATNFLTEQEMSDVLALIMTGCWIESIYIVMESVDAFDVDNPLIERIADQQYLLENLIGLMKTNKKSGTIVDVLDTLKEIQEVYDVLYFNNPDVLITKHQYVNIVNKVREVRNQFVG